MIERQTNWTDPSYITGMGILGLIIDVLAMKQFISLFVVHLLSGRVLNLRSRDHWFTPN